MAVTIKSEREIELMREAGRLLAKTHAELEKEIHAGMTTKEVDHICEEIIRSYGCVPSFLNYNGFPASVCVSINDEVVHGIPTRSRVIHEGDIVSLDTGLIYKGYQSDAARTYGIGAISREAEKLIDTFWPGPLTLVLKRAPHVPPEVAGGQDSIGLRCPSHPVAQALLNAFRRGKGGVAAPSANRFGRVSPTMAQHVREEFDGDPRLGLILDGGQSEVGIESTIVDLSRLETTGPVLLRPGKISAVQIADVIGRLPSAPDAAAPRASGTLASHYAPQTPVVIVPTGEVLSTLIRLEAAKRRVALLRYSPFASERAPRVTTETALSANADVYSHQLYAALRRLDRVGADVIVVEATPDGEAWRGVNDRLKRAACKGQSMLGLLVKA